MMGKFPLLQGMGGRQVKEPTTAIFLQKKLHGSKKIIKSDPGYILQPFSLSSSQAQAENWQQFCQHATISCQHWAYAHDTYPTTISAGFLGQFFPPQANLMGKIIMLLGRVFIESLTTLLAIHADGRGIEPYTRGGCAV